MELNRAYQIVRNQYLFRIEHATNDFSVVDYDGVFFVVSNETVKTIARLFIDLDSNLREWMRVCDLSDQGEANELAKEGKRLFTEIIKTLRDETLE